MQHTNARRTLSPMGALAALVLALVCALGIVALAIPAQAQAAETDVIAHAYLDPLEDDAFQLSIEANQRSESEAGSAYLGPVYDREYARGELPWFESIFGPHGAVSRVVIGDGVKPTSTSQWFSNDGGWTNKFTIDMSALDASALVDMSDMFSDSGVTSVILPDSPSTRLITISQMFSGCSSLASIDMGAFDTSRVTNMRRVFGDCSSLTSLGLTSWDVSNVEDMSGMFVNCSSLESLDLTGWDTSAIDSTRILGMHGMFSECASLHTLDLSSFTTSAEFPLREIEDIDASVAELTLGEHCSVKLAQGTWRRQSDGQLFYPGSQITGSATFAKVDGGANPDDEDCFIFGILDTNGNFTIQTGEPSDIDPGAIVWGACRYGWKVLGDETGDDSFNEKANLVKSVSFANKVEPTSTRNWFAGCSNLETIDFTNLDTSYVTDMSYMFYHCSSLKTLDVSSFDTSAVEDLGGAFMSCYALTSLDLSSWDTSSLGYAGSLFSFCHSIESIDVSGWDTSHVYSMDGMFMSCFALRSLDLSSFDTSCEECYEMFSGCTSLVEMQVGVNFVNTERVNYSPELPDGMWEGSDGTIYRPDSIPSRIADTYRKVADESGSCYLLDESGMLTISRTTAELPDKAGKLGYVADNCRNAGDLPWDTERDKITAVEVRSLGRPATMADWFAGCPSLTEARLCGLRTDSFSHNSHYWDDPLLAGATEFSGWVNASGLFDGCSALRTVSFDDDGLLLHTTDVSRMFRGCTSLESVDLARLDTSKVRDFSEMFYGCASLESLDLSGFGTQRATAASRMFHGCRALQEIKVGSNFTFFGATTQRMPGSEFPDGAWRGDKQVSADAAMAQDADEAADAEGGSAQATHAYASDSIPSFVADTYRRVDAETPGLTVLSIYGAGPDKYALQTTLVDAGDGTMAAELDYEVPETYAADELAVGTSVEANASKVITSGKITQRRLNSVTSKSKKVTSVTVGSGVTKISSGAFAKAKNVTKVTVKSKSLKTSSAVKGCLKGSNVKKVQVKGMSKSAAAKVKKAISKYGRK